MKSKSLNGSEKIFWDLSDLYLSVDDPQIQIDMDDIHKDAINFTNTYKHKVKDLSVNEFLMSQKQLVNIKTKCYKLHQYISLNTAIDTSNHTLNNLESKIDIFNSEISNLLLFYSLELFNLPDSQKTILLKQDSLKNYFYYLNRGFDNAAHQLTEKEEQIINIKDLTGANACEKLYETLSASFEFQFQKNDQTFTLNGSELRALRQDPDPEIRKRAMEQFFKKYEENKIVYTHLYNTIIKDQQKESSLRGYNSVLEPRAKGQNLSEEIINTLESVTTNSYDIVQKYYQLKSRLLNKKLNLSDIYAPLPQAHNTYTYQQSQKIVLDSFKNFDQDFYEKANTMFVENRIHAPVLKNKRGGAFCSGSIPELKPYVMLNFLGRQRDISTMAHELGHAIHDMYAAKQPLRYYHPILPLAETASVFCEMIVTDTLKKTETDPLAKVNLLCNFLEDAFATSHRQNMFHRFEKHCHEKVKTQVLSSSYLCDKYLEELTLLFGNSVKIDPHYQWEWASIPHIFAYPFYVYAYNFGNLLVFSLYQQWKDEGDSFVVKLKKILMSGSCDSPENITKKAGVDISKAAFWQKSIQFLSDTVNELEVLLDQHPEIINNHDSKI